MPDRKLTIDTLSGPMRPNLLRALDRDPKPLTRLHYSQAKALEKRGLVTIRMALMGHPIDKMLGSADVWLTDAGRGIARAIRKGSDA